MRAAKASAKHFELPLEPADVIADYRLAYRSRQASLIGRREVLSGKAKFGIFGDGKELANIAIGHVFRKGDWRSGYYRDQTWMDMLGVMSLQQMFAQLYAHADLEAEPNTGGRGMNAHFASRYVREDGSWIDQTQGFNSAADVSPTGTQMPRAVGLAYASVLYRKLESLKGFRQFSNNGDEVTFATIGNASTAEGLFWESLNAIGVLQAPAIITVFDDGYGISVPNQFQMVKENIHDILEGFRRDDCLDPDCLRGYDLLQVRGWDYATLIETYQHAEQAARMQHIPVLVHVTELTQPQGHSTSGSHERYKTPERLQWEAKFDCIRKMREWMLETGVTSEAELAAHEQQDREAVEGQRRSAWDAYLQPILEERSQVLDILDEMAGGSSQAEGLRKIRDALAALPTPFRRDTHAAAHASLRLLRTEDLPTKQVLAAWKTEQEKVNAQRYGSHLYSGRALRVPEIKPAFSDASPNLNGFEVINAAFDSILSRDAARDRPGRGRGPARRCQPGVQGLAGEVRRMARHRYGHSGGHHTRSGHRNGDARPAAHLRDPVPGLPFVRAPDHVRRSCDPALAHGRRPERAGHRAHARPPFGGCLAFGVAHVRVAGSAARHVRARAS